MKSKAAEMQSGTREIRIVCMRLMFYSKVDSSLAARPSFGMVAEVRQFFKLG